MACIKLTKHRWRYRYYLRIGLFVNGDDGDLQFVGLELLALRTTALSILGAANIDKFTSCL